MESAQGIPKVTAAQSSEALIIISENSWRTGTGPKQTRSTCPYWRKRAQKKEERWRSGLGKNTYYSIAVGRLRKKMNPALEGFVEKDPQPEKRCPFKNGAMCCIITTEYSTL